MQIVFARVVQVKMPQHPPNPCENLRCKKADLFCSASFRIEMSSYELIGYPVLSSLMRLVTPKRSKELPGLAPHRPTEAPVGNDIIQTGGFPVLAEPHSACVRAKPQKKTEPPSR